MLFWLPETVDQMCRRLYRLLKCANHASVSMKPRIQWNIQWKPKLNANLKRRNCFTLAMVSIEKQRINTWFRWNKKEIFANDFLPNMRQMIKFGTVDNFFFFIQIHICNVAYRYKAKNCFQNHFTDHTKSNPKLWIMIFNYV